MGSWIINLCSCIEKHIRQIRKPLQIMGKNIPQNLILKTAKLPIESGV